MKPVPLAALVLLAFAAFGDEKPAVSPHAFRMPKKTVAQPAPEAKPEVASGELRVEGAVAPEADESPKAVEPAGESPLPPTAFQFPKPSPSAPAPAPEAKPRPKAETAKPARPLPFVLPGQKPAPPTKKTPVTFKLPQKKQE